VETLRISPSVPSNHDGEEDSMEEDLGHDDGDTAMRDIADHNSGWEDGDMVNYAACLNREAAALRDLALWCSARRLDNKGIKSQKVSWPFMNKWHHAQG